MLTLTNIPDPFCATTEDRAKHLLRELEKRDIFAVDTETTGLDVLHDIPLYISFAYENFRAVAPDKFIPIFKPVLEDPGKIKCLHNAKFDAWILGNIGIRLQNMHDTLVMARLENSERLSQDLKFLASTLFVPEEADYLSYDSPFGGKIKGIMDFREKYGEDAVFDYASLDALATWNSYWKLADLLQHMDADCNQSVWNLFVQEEVPYTELLYRMERHGILLNTSYLQKQKAEADKLLDKLSGQFCRESKRVINLRSHKQLREFFYEILGKTSSKLTKKGAVPSTDDEVIARWADEGDALAKTLKEFRKIDKLRGTYLAGLLKRTDSIGYVHTSLNQNAAETGRLSSSRPNLQNIPRPEEDVFKIRRAFVASPGMDMLVGDYSGLEMMIIADFAHESGMMKALEEGKDVHSITVELIHGIPYDQILAAKLKSKKDMTEEDERLLKLRYECKTLGFAINYGGGPSTVSRQLGCTEEEAKDKITAYFESRPNLAQYMQECSQRVEKFGYLQTLSGRWRVMSRATSTNFFTAKNESRLATNTIIQGSAADIVRRAMLYCDRSEKLKNLGVSMLLQVHDELMFECPKESSQEAREEIVKLMKMPYADQLRVKLSVDFGIGPNWEEAKV